MSLIQRARTPGLTRVLPAVGRRPMLGRRPTPLVWRPHPAVLDECVLWLDAEDGSASGQSVPNRGWGGTALDARLGSTSGSDTNDPLWLPGGAESYTYLPGSASNTIGCTAPASAASYAAYPTGGGAPTTGAATGGAAFTLQTTGTWVRVDLLNGSAATVASFVSADSTSTGYTDAFSVAWTISRATSGRKSVHVSPGGRPRYLLGTDDYFEIPDNDFLDVAASESFTAGVLVRQWNTVTSFQYMGKNIGGGSPTGWTISPNRFVVHDGTNQALTGSTFTTIGQFTHVVGIRDVVGDIVRRSNNGTYNTNGTDTTTATLANASPLRIGLDGAGGSRYQDFEFFAAYVLRRVITDTEAFQIAQHYEAVA